MHFSFEEKTRTRSNELLPRYMDMSLAAQSVMVGIGVIFDVVEFASGLPQPGDKQHNVVG